MTISFLRLISFLLLALQSLTVAFPIASITYFFFCHSPLLSSALNFFASSWTSQICSCLSAFTFTFLSASQLYFCLSPSYHSVLSSDFTSLVSTPTPVSDFLSPFLSLPPSLLSSLSHPLSPSLPSLFLPLLFFLPLPFPTALFTPVMRIETVLLFPSASLLKHCLVYSRCSINIWMNINGKLP